MLGRKADAQIAAWNEAYGKILEKKRQAEDRDNLKRTAEERTAEALEALETISDFLLHTLGVDDAIDWDVMKDHSDFPVAKPKPLRLAKTPPKPTYADPVFNILDRIF